MKIGILGSGDVALALGKGFLALGHEVMLSSRSSGNEKLQIWAREAGPKASAGTFTQAAQFGQLLVLATLGTATPAAIEATGVEPFKGKVLIDVTNPLDFSKGFPPTLAVGPDASGGELAQRLLPDAKVVKAFNTVGNAHMFRPSFPGGPPDMFICGNDEGARAQVAGIVRDFGWGVIDLGGIESARYLEALCLVWVLHAAKVGTYNHAFKMLRK
jgi:8-hydroxy-5-deazaflavin:NADPH oxidoreductase